MYRRLACLFLALLAASGTVRSHPLSGESLYRQVEHYASLGEHRTGTPEDLATAQWLTQALQAAGFQVEQQPFELQQFFPSRQRLETSQGSFDVFPHWYPKSSEAIIKAPLVPLDSPYLNGSIAYLAPDQVGAWYQVQPAKLASQAAAEGARALVIAVPHPSGELYVTNASPPHLQTPLAIPTVVIAAKHHPQLEPILETGQAIQLQTQGQHRPARAVNVIARYPATPLPKAPWVVVSTPISGWFQCAGERGSGVALWLGLAQTIATRKTGLNWLFVGNSGHELDFMGARASLKQMPEPDSVRLWLHLGASIAARRWQEQDGELIPLNQVHEYNRLYATPALLSEVSSAFDDVPELEILSTATMNRGHSELGTIIDHGYPAFGMVGSHRFFHTPRDTPAVTSPTLLVPYGKALQRMVDQLTQPGMEH